MTDQSQVEKIKEITEDFFSKTSADVISVKVALIPGQADLNSLEPQAKDTANIEVNLKEPQIFIGQQGQTLIEIQRLLRMVLNKKLQAVFYVSLDINDYKRSKTEYLREIVKDLADQVARTRQEKEMTPMSAYERRIVHAELALRTDVETESRGEGLERYVVIKPK